MKAIAGFASLILILVLWAAPILLSCYGLILAFHASIILGIAVLFLQPMPFVIGLVTLFSHHDLAQKIAQLVGLA